MLIGIITVILVILILILLLNITLVIKFNSINRNYRGYIRVIFFGLFKITREFDEVMEFLQKKADMEGEEEERNYVVEFFGKYIKEDKVDLDEVHMLFNRVLDLLNMTKEKVKIKNLELRADYCFDDAALTSVSYGVFSGLLGIVVSYFKNNNIVKDKLSIVINPHFKNSSFMNSSVFCIFTVKLGNIIITGIRIVRYLRRKKKKFKESKEVIDK